MCCSLQCKESCQVLAKQLPTSLSSCSFELFSAIALLTHVLFNRCGVKRASTFHLTPDDMAKCGVLPLPGLSLCVIRDPISRFASEVR